jgi:hypothetical protein
MRCSLKCDGAAFSRADLCKEREYVKGAGAVRRQRVAPHRAGLRRRTVLAGAGAGAVKTGVDTRTCSGQSDTMFRILRQGATGEVDLRGRTNALIDVLFIG